MIQKILSVVVLILALSSYTFADVEIDNLIKQMDGTDKCGQMTQITFQVIQNDTGDDNNPVNMTRLRASILEFKVGSILNTPFDRAQKGVVWQDIIKKIHDVTAESKLKIPVLYGIDSIHGANYIRESTLFPQQLAQGATFNPEMAEKLGEIVAKETRSVGIPWNFSPVMDIGRQVVWPRLWETYGEDVLLCQKLGAAYIKGHQGDNLLNRTKTATCLKHYVGYSMPFNGRDRTPAYIPENLLREYFLPPFEAGIQAGSPSIMINSGDVNGIPGHANYHYLTEILRNELKFTGFTVSDWEDIVRLYTRDKVAETPEEAVRIAVMAGVDMSMVPYDHSFFNHCVSLYNKDQKFVARVNDAVEKILKIKKAIGHLKLSEYVYPKAEELNNLGRQDSDDINLEAARESIVLAKNEDNILPLKRKTNLLVTGPSANLLRTLNGGWSYTWQGNREDYFETFSGRKYKTIVDVLQSNKEANILYREGANFTTVKDLEDAVQEASNSDVVILCIGEDTYTETPGNIDNMMLSEPQRILADSLLNTGKPVVVVYLGGRPRTITSIVNRAKAVLIAFLPGLRGAEAIGDILYGDYNPNGKMPLTYPRGPNGAMPYDHKPIEDHEKYLAPIPASYDPLYPFGHGLSYTKFQYSNLKLNQEIVNEPNSVTGSVDVKNIGDLAGKETVIVYLNDEFGSLSRPVRQMKFFKKITLNPGQQETVNFEITRNDMSFINLDNKRIVETGKFNVYVDELKASFKLNAKVESTTLPTTPSRQSVTMTSTNPTTPTTSGSNIQFINIVLFAISIFLAVFLQ